MSIEAAEVLVPCLDFPAALSYFTTRLKSQGEFRVETLITTGMADIFFLCLLSVVHEGTV